MQNLENIAKGLMDSGINVVYCDNKILTHWIGSNLLKIEIAIFLVGNEEWIKLASFIRKLDANKEDINKLNLLMIRLNNKILGCKFSLDKNNYIICSTEIHQDAFNFKILKNYLLQIVKTVTNFII